jgi:hypothetical protein
MKKFLVIISLVFAAQATHASTWHIFRGTIGKNIGIMMRLEELGEKLYGGYFYTAHGEEIKLTGSLEGNTYKLDELDTSGKVSAHIVFTMTGDSANGTWTSAKKKKKALPIMLKQSHSQLSVLYNHPHWIEFRDDTINHKSKKNKYDISMTYPQILFNDGSYTIELFNAAMKGNATSEATKAMSDFSDRDDEMKQMDDYPDEIGSDMTVGDTVMNPYPPVLSVLFWYDEYWRGAAHPQHSVVTKNYLLTTATWLTMKDIFKPNTKYLEWLSPYCIEDVLKQLTDRHMDDSIKGGQLAIDSARRATREEVDSFYLDWVQRGAGPEEENYRNFTISERGLTIYFDQYQVASYADGPFEVLIPFDKIKDILNPESGVEEAVKR